MVLYHLAFFCIDFFLLYYALKRYPVTVKRFLETVGIGIILMILTVVVLVLCYGGSIYVKYIKEKAPLLGTIFEYVYINRLTEGLFWHGGGCLLVLALILGLRKLKPDQKRQFFLPLFAALIGGLILTIGYRAMIVEPNNIQIVHHRLVSSKITKPMRIAFVADIQTDNIGEHERRTLSLLKSQNADLILFGGDYIQPRNVKHEEKLLAEFNQLFRDAQLNPPLGMYAVRGNLDTGTRSSFRKYFEGSLVLPVINMVSCDIGEIRLTLLDVNRSFWPFRERDENPEGKFHVILGHAPCFAMGEVKAELLLAGHTHGGQVQIPGYGPLFIAAPGVPRLYGTGKTVLPNGSTLIVSHGTGMERGRAPRVRLFCPPQLIVIDLEPEHEHEPVVTPMTHLALTLRELPFRPVRKQVF